MSSVRSRVRGRVGVKTWGMAINYVTNEAFRVWLIILQQRGLDHDKLLSQREVLNKGLFTWLLTRHLKKAMLEVYQENSSEVAERWDMVFTYTDPNEVVSSEEEVNSVWKTYLDEITPFMMSLRALPAGSVYRVVVGLHDEVAGQPPPEVEGWSPTTLRNVSGLQRLDFGEIISAGDRISLCMELLGRWDGRTSSSAIPRERTERESADIQPSLNILPLFAIAQTTLGEGEKALINKTYFILAGVSQSKPDGGDKGEPFDLPLSNIDEPLSLDILLHIGKNIRLITTERFKLLQYDPLNHVPQFVEFPFQVIVPGHCTLDVHFYHEQRWLTAIQIEFEAIENPQQTVVASEV